MRPLKYQKILHIVGWAYVLLIFYLSLTPDPPHVAEFEQGDKLKHLAGYGLLMFWFCQLYASRGAHLAYALLFCAMGVSIEYLQRWGGVRTFEYADMLANATGVGLGYILGPKIKIYRFVERPQPAV